VNKIKLDKDKQVNLIQNIQDFVVKKANMEFSEIQASNLLDYILSEVECSMYDQLLFKTRSDILQKFNEIFGIEDQPLQ